MRVLRFGRGGGGGHYLIERPVTVIYREMHYGLVGNLVIILFMDKTHLFI